MAAIRQALQDLEQQMAFLGRHMLKPQALRNCGFPRIARKAVCNQADRPETRTRHGVSADPDLLLTDAVTDPASTSISMPANLPRSDTKIDRPKLRLCPSGRPAAFFGAGVASAAAFPVHARLPTVRYDGAAAAR
jgi:hypothetical protein